MNLNGPAYRAASWIGIAIASIGLVAALVLTWWIAAVWLAALLAYALWQVAWEERLPDLFDFLLVAAAVINAVGWAFNLFRRFAHYDQVAHGYTIFAITLTAGFLVYGSSEVRFAKTSPLFAVSIFCFGMALGGLWEIVESVFGVIGTIEDTVNDLIMDATGAAAAAVLSAWVAKRAEWRPGNR